MAQFTQIQHDGIEGTARVAESAVARYAEAGWTRVEAPAEETSQEDSAATPAPAPTAADAPAAPSK